MRAGINWLGWIAELSVNLLASDFELAGFLFRIVRVKQRD